jgi:hypothetical protein
METLVDQFDTVQGGTVMDSKIIKRFCKEHLNIPTIRVRTTVSKNPYIDAWIPSEPKERFTDPLVYKYKIPPEFGRICIQVIYKEALGEQCYGGNVRTNGVAMHANEWQQAIDLYLKTKSL